MNIHGRFGLIYSKTPVNPGFFKIFCEWSWKKYDHGWKIPWSY